MVGVSAGLQFVFFQHGIERRRVLGTKLGGHLVGTVMELNELYDIQRGVSLYYAIDKHLR